MMLKHHKDDTRQIRTIANLAKFCGVSLDLQEKESQGKFRVEYNQIDQLLQTECVQDFFKNGDWRDDGAPN